MNLLINSIEDLIKKLYSKCIRYSFKRCGSVYIMPSVRIDNPQHIILESGVSLMRRGWLYAIISQVGEEQPLITIKDDTKIYDNFHITCSKKLEIGKKCLINRNVLITDTIHNYENIDIPIIDQGIRNSPTIIGDNCWIGNNAVIISSIIGKHCVISANSVVVNKSIPDFSVVAGNPSKIIKKFNLNSKTWEKIK